MHSYQASKYIQDVSEMKSNSIVQTRFLQTPKSFWCIKTSLWTGLTLVIELLAWKKQDRWLTGLLSGQERLTWISVNESHKFTVGEMKRSNAKTTRLLTPYETTIIVFLICDSATFSFMLMSLDKW